MAAFVYEAASAHLADLIDAIGELIAAIFDVDHRPAMGHVTTVDVGNPGHAAAVN
jgi:hypothetical protein